MKAQALIEISEALRAHATAAGAERWLTTLPELVDDLQQRWDVMVGRALAGATEGYVAEAVTSDGQPVVLKLLLPLDGPRQRHEITALRLAQGRGCATLLRDDEAVGALLLERLGPSLFELNLPIRRRHEILCDTAAQVWRSVPGSDLPSGGDRARQLADDIALAWVELDRPCSRGAIDHALLCAERREAAHQDERAVLVHGDVHQLNALQAGPAFKLIDPDGLRAEPEYDLGTIMRGDPVELLQGDPRERAQRLAARTGRDARAIWEWGVIERVASGLHCTEIDVQPLGQQTLAAADDIASRR